MAGGELFDRIQKKGHFTERGIYTKYMCTVHVHCMCVCVCVCVKVPCVHSVMLTDSSCTHVYLHNLFPTYALHHCYTAFCACACVCVQGEHSVDVLLVYKSLANVLALYLESVNIHV